MSEIIKINGSLVVAKDLDAKLHDMVYVGKNKLVGEVIKIEENLAYIQVFEETEGLEIGEEVISLNRPISAILGPGLLSRIFDGIQRPLDLFNHNLRTAKKDVFPLENKKYEFIPLVKEGKEVKGGDILGFVMENNFKHYILVPHGIKGKIDELRNGKIKIKEILGKINDKEIYLYQTWPIRKARPFKERLEPNLPMITGIRVIDVLFPIAKGGTAAIPGGFGTGKTITQQTIAKYSDVDVIIYIGCGERGNEMAELLEEFEELEDANGNKLINRTVLIVNTSNMPMAARESSIYLGATIGEYFREQGYDIALMADSTSRWAEALREISSRLMEMPSEEGYPSYLNTRISEFYSRAGRVINNNDKIGSLSIIGAVSPPSGDFSEPVTQATLNTVRVLWMLDKELAKRRHYPAISYLNSYSMYIENIKYFWEKIEKDYLKLRNFALEVLSLEEQLREIIEIVGKENLRDIDKLNLITGKIIREGFLKQNAFNEDAHNSVEKEILILKAIYEFYEHYLDKLKHEELKINNKIVEEIIRLKEAKNEEILEKYDKIIEMIRND